MEFAATQGTPEIVELETKVSPHRARVIDMPLTGRVLNRDGHDELAHHRRWTHALPFLRSLGFASNGMRYAYDFVRVDDAGALYSGDRTRNENWYSFGAVLRAVADGTVVKAVANHPDDASFDPNESLKDPNALFGNYLVIDLGNGAFALYGHLRQDSISVKIGDRVRRGQPVAAVGNSGSAEFPHLHFQLMDAPDMRGEGVPSLFREFIRQDGNRPARVRQGAFAPGETVVVDP